MTMQTVHEAPQGATPPPNALRKLGDPQAPPIMLNGEGSFVTLGEHRISLYPFQGQRVAIAGHLDAPLDYEPKGVAQLIRGEWAPEFKESEHFLVIAGDDLRKFKADAAQGGVTPPCAPNVRSLMLLTEAGIDRAVLLSRKKAGADARAFTADEVFPKLRRGETVSLVPSADLASASATLSALDVSKLAVAVAGVLLPLVLAPVNSALANVATRADLAAVREEVAVVAAATKTILANGQAMSTEVQALRDLLREHQGGTIPSDLVKKFRQDAEDHAIVMVEIAAAVSLASARQLLRRALFEGIEFQGKDPQIALCPMSQYARVRKRLDDRRAEGFRIRTHFARIGVPLVRVVRSRKPGEPIQ